MPEPNPIEHLLREPLSEITRKERRILLGVSAFGIAVAKTGLVPTKISTLGIEFSQAESSTLLKMLAAVVIYFLVAFLIYAVSDFAAWRARGHALEEETMKQLVEEAGEAPGPLIATASAKRVDSRLLGELRRLREERANFFRYSAAPVSILRVAFDFLVPPILGGYAILLLFAGPPSP